MAPCNLSITSRNQNACHWVNVDRLLVLTGLGNVSRTDRSLDAERIVLFDFNEEHDLVGTGSVH